MSSLGQMVAGIAHELNNPTAFVRGNLDHADQCMQDILSLLQLYQQYLPETPTDIQTKIEEIDLDFIIQDLPGCLQSMRNGTARIQDIVLSLRTFSHLDESKVKLTNLSENLASIWSLLNYRLLASGIEVIEDYHELPEIESDAAELNQVFFHILSNAIDALEEVKKETDKYIKITGKVIDTTTIEIDIINNGLPIQERIKSRIFDPFFTTKSVGKGSGMGLTICYQIMQKHNGNLAVQSTPTETIFKLVMPIHWQA
jgi:signal transduction histidine kinase